MRSGGAPGAWILFAGLLSLVPLRIARGEEPATDARIESPETRRWTLELLRPKRSWLQRIHAGNWRTTLGFGLEWNRQASSSEGGSDVSADYLDFREQVSVGTSGFFFHPSLLEFSTDVVLGFTQNRTSSPGSSDSSDARLLGFSTSGVFLRDQPANLLVFGNRNENTFNRGFGACLEGKGYTVK